jgi:very-short-patch-repair endonuclease
MGEHDAVVDTLAALGGEASPAELRALTSRRRVQRAVADGAVLRHRGRLSLPVLDETVAAVRDLGGARSHLSAALHHGWAVPGAPDRPMVTIPRTAHLPATGARTVRVFWGPLTPDELEAGVTGHARTVVDCARVLPFADAVAVADSALRAHDVSRTALGSAARASPRTGRARAVRVIEAADDRSANVFESLLRAISLGVPGLHLVPQVTIGGEDLIGTPDLVDVDLAIAVEAESWRYHGGRRDFDRDVRRYTAMACAGWLVLRFLWDDVRNHPEEVQRVLREAVALRRQRRT